MAQKVTGCARAAFSLLCGITHRMQIKNWKNRWKERREWNDRDRGLERKKKSSEEGEKVGKFFCEKTWMRRCC